MERIEDENLAINDGVWVSWGHGDGEGELDSWGTGYGSGNVMDYGIISPHHSVGLPYDDHDVAYVGMEEIWRR